MKEASNITKIFFRSFELKGNKTENRSFLSQKAKELVLSKACEKLNMPKDSVVIKIGKNSKPYIDGFHFNISHTLDAFVIAISDDEVGIDIEKIRDINLKGLEEHIGCEITDIKEFFKLWTKKESAVKQKGLTLKELKTIDISKTETFYIDDYVISVCCENDQETELKIL